MLAAWIRAGMLFATLRRVARLACRVAGLALGFRGAGAAPFRYGCQQGIGSPGGEHASGALGAVPDARLGDGTLRSGLTWRHGRGCDGRQDP